jgi:hypothetical protein
MPEAADVYIASDGKGGFILSNVHRPGRHYERVISESTAEAGRPTRMVTGRPYADLVAAAALANDVPQALLHALIKAESGYNPKARSPKGAAGLMQLMPDTAKEMGVKDVLTRKSNVQGGARYLKRMLTLFDNDITLAVAAYNAGPEAVLSRGKVVPPFAETRRYVPNVLRDYRLLRGWPTIRRCSQVAWRPLGRESAGQWRKTIMVSPTLGYNLETGAQPRSPPWTSPPSRHTHACRRGQLGPPAIQPAALVCLGQPGHHRFGGRGLGLIQPLHHRRERRARCVADRPVHHLDCRRRGAPCVDPQCAHHGRAARPAHRPRHARCRPRGPAQGPRRASTISPTCRTCSWPTSMPRPHGDLVEQPGADGQADRGRRRPGPGLRVQDAGLGQLPRFRQARAEQKFVTPPEQLFIENYIPLFDADGDQVTAMVEIYKEPHDLIVRIEHGLILIWLAITVGAALVYVGLYGIMHRAARLLAVQQKRLISNAKPTWRWARCLRRWPTACATRWPASAPAPSWPRRSTRARRNARSTTSSARSTVCRSGCARCCSRCAR